MTLANKITLTRIGMIPFFIYCALQTGGGWQIGALALFCIASATDFLDGYVARKYNQVTDFGKFVDPLADKLLVTAALLIFTEKGIFPAWMVFVVLAREFIITSLRIVAVGQGRVLAATWTGKIKTCVQIGGIIVLFLLLIDAGGSAATLLSCTWPVANTLLDITTWTVTLVTLYSGIDYLYKNRDLIRNA